MIQYTKVVDANGTIVSAYIDGNIYVIHGGNRMFDGIMKKLEAGDKSVAHDFDLAGMISSKFAEVSSRVALVGREAYLDGKKIEPQFTDIVIRYVNEGNDNLLPLVKFIERLDKNPSFNSRAQFWSFVERNGIHIDDDGYCIMYKGVRRTDESDVYESVHAGTAEVNGLLQKDQRIRTKVGDVVTMPRREISDNPNVGCHKGLHCGARSYAESFARVLLTVRVDPQHVVSVPADCSQQKVRVEQYEIMDVVGGRHIDTVRWTDEDYDYYDDDEGHDWSVY